MHLPFILVLLQIKKMACMKWHETNNKFSLLKFFNFREFQ